MKIIERPESTTIVFEYPYHFLKDENEVRNVLSFVNKKDIIITQKYCDHFSFQPMLGFAIRMKNKPFSEWLKYVTKTELVEGYKDKLFNKKGK